MPPRARPRRRNFSAAPPASQAQSNDVVIKTADGQPIVMVFRGGLEVNLRDPGEHESWTEYLRQVLDARNLVHPPSEPPKAGQDDYCYRLTKPECDAKRILCGVTTYGIWAPHGKSYMTETNDTLKDREQVEAFYAALTPVIEGVSIYLDTLAPDCYERYRKAVKKYIEEDPTEVSRQYLSPAANTAWLNITHVVNLRTLPRRHHTQPIDGWAAMTPVGDYEGGDIVLPQFKLRIALNPGDIMLFRSALLEYCVAPFTGQRSHLLFFSNEDGVNLQKDICRPSV